MDGMRVLYFHQHFSTPSGSMGIRSYQMARRLIADGHRVTMICGSCQGGSTGLDGPFVRKRRRGTVDGIDIIEFDLSYSNSDGFWKRTATFLSFAIRSIGLAIREPYDVAFSTTTPLTAGIPGIFARWLRGKPFVFEVRDLWPELPRAMGVIKNPVVLGAMSLLEWASYRSATSCIALSPGIVDGIAKRGVDRRRIVLVPNGCDLRIFGSRSAPWRPPGVADTDLMAVFAGTHGIANGLDAAIDVAAELKRRSHADIKLVLIGQGALKAGLVERAKADNLDSITFLEPVDKQKLAGLLAASDVGLQLLADVPAFYYGTSPNKFFDYIAAGLPVLNNYPGWLAQMIVDNDCGFAVPPRDPVAFADALEAAAADRAALKAKGRRGRVLAEQQFDRDALAARFVKVLEASAQKDLGKIGGLSPGSSIEVRPQG